MATGGVAGGWDDGAGNYGTAHCTRCDNINHLIFIIKDANLAVIICPGCAEISTAIKIDSSADPDDISREVESRRDVVEYVSNLKLTLGTMRKNPTKEN